MPGFGTNFSMGNVGLPVNSNEASQTFANSYNQVGTTAKLFLFAPRNIVNTCKRPHVYNFNMNFIEDLKDNIGNILNKVGNDYVAASFMHKYPSSIDAVSVDPQGFTMNNSVFSNLWSFVLQIDNDQMETNGMYSGPRLCNRFIYSGFCMGDEPVSMLDGLRVTVNPRCVLKITHSTSMRMQKKFSTSGDMSIMRVNSDVDFIPPDVTMQLNNNITHLITPEAVFGNVVENPIDHSVYVSNKDALATKSSTPIGVQTNFNSPKHHLHNVVRTLTTSMDSISTDKYGSGMISMSGSPVFGDTEVLKNVFATNISTPLADNLISLDGTQSYFISQLQEKYPGLQIIPIKASNTQSQFDLCDQSVVARSNIASSIVVSALPMIISDSGLCEFGFFYRSVNPTASFSMFTNEDADYQLQVINVAPWVPEPTEVTKQRIKSVLRSLRYQVFPILKNMGGEFDLSVSCNSAGECDAMLIFLDDSQNAQGIYESPLLLGGLNSPLVASKGTMEHNSNHLSTMLTAMSTELYNDMSQPMAMPFNQPVNHMYDSTFANTPMANPFEPEIARTNF